MASETVTITTTLRHSKSTKYVSIPALAAKELGIEPGDAIVVKIGRARIPDGFD